MEPQSKTNQIGVLSSREVGGLGFRSKGVWGVGFRVEGELKGVWGGGFRAWG